MTEGKRRRRPASGFAPPGDKPDIIRGFAETQQLLEGPKSHTLSVRLHESLVTAAKKRTGIVSDTELAEYALASVALGDDYGEWLLSQAGGLDPSFDLDL